MPDIETKTLIANASTAALLKTKAIFNFATHYFYENPKIDRLADFSFKNSDFYKFTNYLKSDTTFVTLQESLFKKAFLASKGTSISRAYPKIKAELFDDKIIEISKNKALILTRIRTEILARFFYMEGVYQDRLRNDRMISEALVLLRNKDIYTRVLLNN